MSKRGVFLTLDYGVFNKCKIIIFPRKNVNHCKFIIPSWNEWKLVFRITSFEKYYTKRLEKAL